MSIRLFRSTATVGGMTVISRVLGFMRDMVVARLFGAGFVADAFFVAFRIPNLLRRLFAEGAFAQAFVPVLSEYRNQRTQAETKNLVDHTAGALAGWLGLATVVGIVTAPILVLVFAPGFTANPDKYALTVDMLRITFPYLLFISLAGFASGILQTYGRFAVPAFTPAFLNLSIIGAAIWLAPHMQQPVVALAWGVFVGGAVQLLFQLPFLLPLKLLPRPRIKRGDEGVRRILKLMGPAIFGVSVAQINLLVDTLLASFLITGSVSWLYYSDRLVEFPLGVFGVALATVILPSLADKHTRGSAESFAGTLDWALRCVLVIALPAALGIALLAGPMLCTLFQYGEFSGHDVEMSARSLIAFAFGLIAFVFIKVLAPGYYARQDTRTPVRVGVIAMLTNILLNAVLIWPLAHAGLALATSLSAYINAALLYRGLHQANIYRPLPGWGMFLARVIVAAALMILLLALGRGEIGEWHHWTAAERALRLGALIASAGFVYVGALWVGGLRWEHMRAFHPSV
ncbi:MAG: murein biosynthesis integral membrane protein MurJ [Gammaproteobacteria bacterium]